MSGEPTHTASEMAPCAPAISISIWKWSIHYAALSAMFNPLHSILNQELFEKHLCNSRIPKKKRNGAARPSYIDYRLKSEVSITRLCSTH